MEYRLRVPTMDNVPFTIRADYARIQAASLCTLRTAYDLGEGASIIRGWKLFCLLSRMLLHKLRRGGKTGTKELRRRIDLFDNGHWDVLLNSAKECGVGGQPRKQQTGAGASAAQQERARLLIQRGELSHAARALRGTGLAPGTSNTLTQLTNPALRPPALTVGFSEAALHYLPGEPLHLDRDLLATNLRSARRGLSPGVGGTRNEHLKLALEDEAALGHLGEIAERLAQADVAGEIAAALRMCRTMALVKAGEKIRGTCARDSFPRLVARGAERPMVGRYALLGFQKSLEPRNTLYTLPSEPQPDHKRIHITCLHARVEHGPI